MIVEDVERGCCLHGKLTCCLFYFVKVAQVVVDLLSLSFEDC